MVPVLALVGCFLLQSCSQSQIVPSLRLGQPLKAALVERVSRLINPGSMPICPLPVTGMAMVDVVPGIQLDLAYRKIPYPGQIVEPGEESRLLALGEAQLELALDHFLASSLAILRTAISMIAACDTPTFWARSLMSLFASGLKRILVCSFLSIHQIYNKVCYSARGNKIFQSSTFIQPESSPAGTPVPGIALFFGL